MKRQRDSTCCICLEEETDVTLRMCQHSFHMACIAKLYSDTCPLCKAPLEACDIGAAILSSIRERQDRERQEQVELETVMLQTVDFFPTRIDLSLPGSPYFRKIFCYLIATQSPEVLMSFQSANDFIDHYYPHILCPNATVALGLIHEIFFNLETNEYDQCFRETFPEYERVMVFLLPRSRIDTNICMESCLEKFPCLNRTNVKHLLRDMERIELGFELLATSFKDYSL